ncbi:hypothetical protein GGF46_001654 [Coemansia sp. RSA 552]|nr:hypothetical protein GGF46_001654 [Coemansia sp. RSA 552]
MSSYTYSPADPEEEEPSRAYTPAVDPGEAGSSGSAPKRQRLFYEGEPDTSKWAVPPAPDIFASKPDSTGPLPSDPVCDEPPEDSIAAADQPPEDVYNGGSDVSADPEPGLDLLSEAARRRVRDLCAAQNGFERRLYQYREQILRGHEMAMGQLEAREIIGPIPKKEKDEVLRKHRAELDRADRRAVEKLDLLRYQQQKELQELGIPGIYPSSDTEVMQRQQAILRRLLEH